MRRLLLAAALAVTLAGCADHLSAVDETAGLGPRIGGQPTGPTFGTVDDVVAVIGRAGFDCAGAPIEIPPAQLSDFGPVVAAGMCELRRTRDHLMIFLLDDGSARLSGDRPVVDRVVEAMPAVAP